jgi:hypothetical protein
LNENVQNLAIMIDGTPQVHSLFTDRDEHLIEMPQRMSRAAMLAQAPSDLRPELRDPASDGLVGVDDPALC